MSIRILNADCLTALPQLAAEGFRAHSVVCDPPYHLTSGNAVYDLSTTSAGNPRVRRGTKGGGFMGQQWDGGDVAFRSETWRAVFDCMLPGAHLVAFGSTRTFHRMVCAIEDAGFEIRDTLCWLYGTGFNKVGYIRDGAGEIVQEGWAGSLKPAFEPIILARKPLEKGLSVAANVLRHGTGALNIDACRVGIDETERGIIDARSGTGQATDGWGNIGNRAQGERYTSHTSGRWPANVLHSGDAEVEEAFARFGQRASGELHPWHDAKPSANGSMSGGNYEGRVKSSFGGDTGSAARFFKSCPYEEHELSGLRFHFCGKADATDRAGSRHPCVKPQSLMSWLVQLVTPPGGTVLDCFAGTGSTGLAADRLGMNAVLIERDAKYAEDARRKIESDAPLFADVRQPTPDLDAAYQRQPGLFEAAD